MPHYKGSKKWKNAIIEQQLRRKKHKNYLTEHAERQEIHNINTNFIKKQTKRLDGCDEYISNNDLIKIRKIKKIMLADSGYLRFLKRKIKLTK